MDAILYWNNVALEANRVTHTTPGSTEQTGPVLSARALAIVHLAMHDALSGITQDATLPQYLASLPPLPAMNNPADAANAAISAAAHASLVALYPSQRSTFDKAQTTNGLTGSQHDMLAGYEYGLSVAQAVLKLRAADPSVSDMGYCPPSSHGGHRPDPQSPNQGYYAPFFGKRSNLFGTTERYQLNAPPSPLSTDPSERAAYVAALKQVRGKGIAPELEGSVPAGYKRRTTEETLIGLYWGYDGAIGLGTPPRLYNQIIREVAMKQGNTLAKNARLFALCNAAMADAGILAWEQKYKHTLWRPVLGVREHDESMGPGGQDNPNTGFSSECDPYWLPLGKPSSNNKGAVNGTPPFPAYPSGHATFGAAAYDTVRRFYNVTAQGPDNLFKDLSFVSDELNGVTTDNQGTVRPKHVRKFKDGLWQMILENGWSRIWLGVHWSFDAFAVDSQGNPDLSKNIGGVPLGLNVAQDLFANAAHPGWSQNAKPGTPA